MLLGSSRYECLSLHFGFFWRHQVCQFSWLQVWWSSQLFLDASSNGELTTFQDSLVSTQSVAWLCVLTSVTRGPPRPVWSRSPRLSHTLLVPTCLRSSAVHSWVHRTLTPLSPSLSPKGAEFSCEKQEGRVFKNDHS